MVLQYRQRKMSPRVILNLLSWKEIPFYEPQHSLIVKVGEEAGEAVAAEVELAEAELVAVVAELEEVEVELEVDMIQIMT